MLRVLLFALILTPAVAIAGPSLSAYGTTTTTDCSADCAGSEDRDPPAGIGFSYTGEGPASYLLTVGVSKKQGFVGAGIKLGSRAIQARLAPALVFDEGGYEFGGQYPTVDAMDWGYGVVAELSTYGVFARYIGFRVEHTFRSAYRSGGTVFNASANPTVTGHRAQIGYRHAF